MKLPVTGVEGLLYDSWTGLVYYQDRGRVKAIELKRLPPADQAVISEMQKGVLAPEKTIKRAPLRRVRRNPPAVKIYNRVIKIYASKSGMKHKCDAQCVKTKHNYVHSFKKRACIYGLPDGSLLIK